MSPFARLHLLVLLIASTAILGRLISTSAGVLVSWRTFLAAAGAFAWVALVRKNRIWPGTRAVVPLLGIGLIIGLHWLAFFGSIKLANVSVCLVGLATISLFTAFTEPLILRRKVRPFEVGLGLLVLSGIAIIAGFDTDHLPGFGLALASALLAAIFPVLNRLLVTRGGDPLTMVGWEMCGALIACLIALPVIDPVGLPALFEVRGRDWIWLMILALICTVFGHAYHIHLLRKITAYAANLAFNFEPIYGIIAASLIFSEYKQFQPTFYLGAAAILSANLLHPLFERRSRPVIPIAPPT